MGILATDFKILDVRHAETGEVALRTPHRRGRPIRKLRDGSVAVHPTEDIPVELFRHDCVEWNRAD